MGTAPEAALEQLQQHVAAFSARTEQRMHRLTAHAQVALPVSPLLPWEEAMAGLREHAERATQRTIDAENLLASVEQSLSNLLAQGETLMQRTKTLSSKSHTR